MCKVVAYDRQHEYPNLNSSITHTRGFPSSNRYNDIIIQSTLNDGIKCYISVMIRVNLVMKLYSLVDAIGAFENTSLTGFT